MTTESWLLGPPGTGKTSTLSNMIQAAVRQYGSDGVLVSSFTKAAAVELAGRGLPIDSERVGTLHSICYRALGFPEIAESYIAEFNEEYPQHALVKGSINNDDPGWEFEQQTTNDAYFAAYQAQRTRMIPVTRMTFNGTYDQDFVDCIDAWRTWKRENGYLDFCDLLDRALYDLDGSPLDASILFVDEAQDCGPLHMAVARKWASGMEKLVLAFDEEQSLYSWMGADPQQLFQTEPDEKTVLAQSYRVPREVHALADRWRKRLSWRIEKEYLPRDTDGFVSRRFDLDCKHPGGVVKLAKRYVEEGKSVMVLASCAYMLKDTIAALKAEGLPYHNPYKPRRVDWNPLDPGSSKRMTPLRRVQSYLRVRPDVFGIDAREWNTEQFRAWALHVRADDLFKRGTKSQLASREFVYQGWSNLAQEGADFTGALRGDLGWLDDRLMGDTGERMRYPVRIAKKLGPKALLAKPSVTVGTIHCSPADEPVLTTDGWVPIGALDPEIHRLAGYDARTNRLSWGGRSGPPSPDYVRGYSLAVARNPYDGPMLTMTTPYSVTRVTPTHRMRVKFSDDFYGKWVVYLMRRGDWWRVGVCTSGRRPYVAGGVRGRMATEQADAGWILGVYESRREACIAEAVAHARYGVPSLTFEASIGRALKRADLHEIHESTKGAVFERVLDLMADVGLFLDAPLYRRDGQRRNMDGYAFETVAANVLDGYMYLPVTDEGFTSRSSPVWLPVSVERSHYKGDVYSLEVPPFEHYISGGAVVHNSVKGAEADVVMIYPDLSALGYDEWTAGGARKDSVLRMAYVGMTRAREGLILCGNGGQRYMSWS